MDDGALPSLRPSDADRERVERVLRQHLREGRLTIEDFELRLDSLYGARTLPELERASAGLDVGGSTATEPARATRAVRARRAAVVAAVLGVSAAATSIAAGEDPFGDERRSPSAVVAASDGSLDFAPPLAADVPPAFLLEDLDEDTPGRGTAAQAADHYLRAVVEEDWVEVQASLCRPLRDHFGTVSDVERRIRSELEALPEQFLLLEPRPAHPNRVRFSLQGLDWAGGPYEIRLVADPDTGDWRACGAGRDRGALGYLVAP